MLSEVQPDVRNVKLNVRKERCGSPKLYPTFSMMERVSNKTNVNVKS